MESIHTLLRYKAWADAVFLDALAAVPEAALTAPQPILFGSLLRTLHHAYAMDVAWKANLLGEAHGMTTRNPEHCPRFDELRRMQADIDGWYVDYADALSPSALTERVGFTFIGGGAGALSRGEILLHVANHATYHRGHAAGMLYPIGVMPPTTDLPVFLSERTQSAWRIAG